MGKIGDLFVRLGLKKEGFSKGMQEAKQETQKFGKTLTDLKAGALAVWAAIGAGVIKLGKDIISSTNLAGDSWDKTISSMKASYHSLIAELTEKTANKKGFWMQFFNRTGDAAYKAGANAKAAGDAAKRMTEAFDAEFELAHSVRLQRGAIQQELNELYITMRDTTLTPEARMAAAERYRALLEPIAEAEVRTYGNMMNIAIEAWQAGTDLDRIYSTEEVVEFFSKIGTETDAMKEKYADLFRVFNNRKGDKQNTIIFDIIAQYQQAASQMSEVDKQISRITRSIKDNVYKPIEMGLEKLGGIGAGATTALQVPDILPDDWVDRQIENGKRLGEEYMAMVAEIEGLNNILANSLTDAFSSGLQSITDFIVGVDSASVEQVISAFIQPIAGMMKHMGEMFMAEGIAEMELITGTPAQKIAAGAALIAVSSAISSGLSKMSATLGGGGTTASTAQSATASAQQLEQEITINVVGEISGDKIILAGQKTLNKWSR